MKWTDHPILKPPTAEEVARLTKNADGSDNEKGLERLLDLWQAHEEAIKSAEIDPLNFGWVLEPWRDLENLLEEFNLVMALGGNRSSKSTGGARMVVKAALKNPRSHILCFAQDHDASVKIQQRYVYEYLPPEFRETMRSETAYTKYSQKNGFTGDGFILPNGSQVSFHAYSQFQTNRAKFEGLELGSKMPKYLNIGLWLDEYLGNGDLVETMRYRLVTRDAKMLLTFTPIEGYTVFLAKYLRAAITVARRKAELLGGEYLDYIQKVEELNAGMIYFFTEMNPFAGYDRLKQELVNCTRDEIMTRAYGHPVRQIDTLFPRFRRDVNVIAHDKLPNVTSNAFTRYMVIDPAGSKSWFITWIAVDAIGDWYVYREWPSWSDGEWAIMGRKNWTLGPSAKGQNRGTPEYCRIIKELEKNEQMFERFIDPRYGSSRFQGRTLIDDIGDEGLIMIPAPGSHEEDGIQVLVNLMDYNTKIPVGPGNKPHLFLSDRCENTIRALLEYQNSGAYDEAWKDPVDCLRYAATAEIRHFEKHSIKTTRIGKGGY